MGDILGHYAELVTDPAHTLVELTFVLVIDVIILGVVGKWFTRKLKRRDRDHGHDE